MRIPARSNRPVQAPLTSAHRLRAATSGSIAFVAAVLTITILGIWLRSVDGRVRAAPIQTDQIPPTETDQIPTTPTAPTDKDYPELQQAMTKLQDRDAKGAFSILEEAKAKYPELPSARVMLGRMLFATNQAAAAATMIEQAVLEAPDDPEPYLTLADFAIQARRFTEAELLFQKADQLNEQSAADESHRQTTKARVLSGLTSVAEVRQNWPGAREHLEAWLEIEPENAGARHRLGRALFGLSSLEEGDKDKQKELQNAAWEALKAANDAEPNLPAAAVTMGNFFEQSGDRETAKKWIDYAAKSNPDELRTQLGIARWYWQTNQPAGAEPYARTALQLDENSLDAKRLSGLIAHALRKIDDAERFFDSANRQSPSDFMATNQLSLVLADQEDPVKRRRALELAQMNFRQYPRRADAAATLGWVLYRNGRANEAAQNLRTAASAGTISPETAYYLARLESDRGQNVNAKKWLDGALQSTAPFVHRSDAQALHDRLASAVNPSGGQSSVPPTTVP